MEMKAYKTHTSVFFEVAVRLPHYFRSVKMMMPT